jgi:hypothetical protein
MLIASAPQPALKQPVELAAADKRYASEGHASARFSPRVSFRLNHVNATIWVAIAGV